MPPRKSQTKKPRKDVAALAHPDDARTNIPTAEFEAMVDPTARAALLIAYERRNSDLDPQLVWRGKDVADWSQLVVPAPPIYIQEKVHPLALIRDLERQQHDGSGDAYGEQIDLFAEFDGPGEEEFDKTSFYEHDQGWTNRLILGDSLQVMASLAEREGLRGQVQAIYFDPPYGIRFNSNFQWSTTSRDVKDGRPEHITREPEQVRAFRDTWRDGIHSYLSYLRDRLAVARDLLHETGSLFVQIGDENAHRVRAVVDEVFGPENVITQIAFRTTTGRPNSYLAEALNYLIWVARDAGKTKYRPLFQDKAKGASVADVYTLLRLPSGETRRMSQAERAGRVPLPDGARVFRSSGLTSGRSAGDGDVRSFTFNGVAYSPGKRTFSTNEVGLQRLGKAGRLWPTSKGSLNYIRYFDDFPVVPLTNVWTDTGTGSFTDEKVYVVQTNRKVIERCLLMTTDPGDLVLDPTIGSGTTSAVAETWGRRWIGIDTSRVALALARARMMGARFPFFVLADSPEGLRAEAGLTGRAVPDRPTFRSVRQGFVYHRVPHITLGAIARNTEIDVIWEEWAPSIAAALERIASTTGATFKEWEVPREAEAGWPPEAGPAIDAYWEAWRSRQTAIDAAITAQADEEPLVDEPVEDPSSVRVSGPFTVESLSPHRTLGVDEFGDIALDVPGDAGLAPAQEFAEVILENLRTAGVQQAHKEDRIEFDSLAAWPGDLICAEGRYDDGTGQRRAGVFIGPEFGTVQRADLVAAAREASEAGFDVLIACAFNYEAHTTEFAKLGALPVLKARMNADLHMADDLKNTGSGNLFVIFGEPDIELIDLPDGQVQVKILGVDVFDPSSGEVRSDNVDGIAAWFIDTDYDEESFFVRHAYFLGADDPYKSLKTSLKAEIDAEAWESLNSDVSRPFERPASGRIAVKVINHLGDEVMKVFRLTS